jgi:hypothetical protein
MKHEIHLNTILKFSSYRTENTLCHHNKFQLVNDSLGELLVFWQLHKTINILCGYNAEVSSVEVGGKYSSPVDLNG